MTLQHRILQLMERMWLRPCVAVILMLALWSCSSDDVPSGAGSGDGELRAGFNIVVNNISNGSSRTSRSDYYQDGTGYENYIDVENGDFRFLFFDANNRYITSLDVERVIPVDNTQSAKIYYVVGKIGQSVIGDYVKVLAIANWGAATYFNIQLVEGKTTIDDIANAAIYNYNASKSFPAADNLIPFYGITNAIKLNVDRNHMADAGTIHMLRAIAKVDVELADTDEGKNTLESVTLVNHSSCGYKAPAKVYSQNDYVYLNYYPSYKTPHIPDNSVVEESVPFEQVSERMFRIYVPEFKNVGVEESKRSYIIAHFKGYNEDTDIRVDFKFYDSESATAAGSKLNDPFDIVRNYWYRFVLESTPTGVVVKMIPYSEVALKPDFGLVIGPNWVPVYDDDINVKYWYDRDTGQYYNEKRQPIENPFWSEDPATGWAIVRDDDGNFLYYYDAINGKCYNEKKEEIPNPNKAETTPEGWIIIRNVSGEVLYYFDDLNKQYYDKDKNPIANPYEPPVTEYDENGWVIIRDKDKNIQYYYDEENEQYYDSAKNPIPNPYIVKEE